MDKKKREKGNSILVALKKTEATFETNKSSNLGLRIMISNGEMKKLGTYDTSFGSEFVSLMIIRRATITIIITGTQ